MRQASSGWTGWVCGIAAALVTIGLICGCDRPASPAAALGDFVTELVRRVLAALLL